MKFKKYWRKTSFKKIKDGEYLLNHIKKLKPKNVLEVGIFQGVTSRNICEVLKIMNGDDFRFTGIDIFEINKNSKDEHIPNIKFSNILKTIYYKYIIRMEPYSLRSVNKLLEKFKNNVTIIKGDSNKILKDVSMKFDYVFLDGGHKYETVKNDLMYLTQVVNNGGVILCDDYNLTYAPGVKKAIDEFAFQKKFSLKILNSRFAEISK